jgi:hypothetical protein
MRTDHRLGTFTDVLAGVDPAVARIARRLRALIRTVHPDAVEVPRPGERTVAYGLGPKKMSEAYAYIAPFTHHVNLGFYHGAALPDVHRLLEGTGKGLRHVKVHSERDVGRLALRELLQHALRERRSALSTRAV